MTAKPLTKSLHTVTVVARIAIRNGHKGAPIQTRRDVHMVVDYALELIGHDPAALPDDDATYDACMRAVAKAFKVSL